MHDTDSQGNEFFKCDSCLSAWSDDRPMVEGHRGSLLCAPCLSVAYDHVVLQGAGETLPPGITCVMCLEPRKDPCWQSSARPEVFVCLRCIKQSARVLEKDPESGWKRPGETGQPTPPGRESDVGDDDGDDDDETGRGISDP